MQKFIISSSPHARDNISTGKIMGLVIAALIPSVFSSVMVFGMRSLVLIAICVTSCVLFETICNALRHKKNTINDLSAVVTGILLAFNLPSMLPWWIAMIGSFVAIVVVKQLFGGLGHNFANPAIVGRIVLMLSFPTAMTTWQTPYSYLDEIVTTGATPLVTGTATYKELFFGKCGGCLGETSAAMLLAGGLLLIAFNIISPSTPIAFIGTVFVFSWITGNDSVYQILAGGVFLGAFFMATDYVTTPVTTKGKIIFGIGCGIITCIIRFYGSYPEGVSFSILIMNLLTPYIDMITRTKPLGAKKPTKEAK